MSDVGVVAHLQRSQSQLPVHSYIDPALLEAERRLLFSQAQYVGHAAMVPRLCDYATVPWEDHARVLVRNTGGIELLSNVCRHRQAIMLEGRGNTHNIVCPLHRWTYDLKGSLLGAPSFGENPCLDLESNRLSAWQSLQFAGPEASRNKLIEALQSMACANELSFDGYVLDRVHTHECAYNWKTFIEVYLEDYHVEPSHPGLGRFVTCDDLKWEFNDLFSVQTVGVNNALAKPGSEVYKNWHRAVLDYRSGEPPAHGAIWLTIYPNIMVEWYPHVLVVSTLHPTAPNRTTNVVEFYYPEDIAHFERGFIEAQQAAYFETCAEDDEIAARMDRGRRALFAQGKNQIGPYQSPMEDGMQHFHEYLRRLLAGRIDALPELQPELQPTSSPYLAL